MIEKGIRDRMCHVITRYAKAKNKYTSCCNKDKKSSYLMYWDVNNLYWEKI